MRAIILMIMMCLPLCASAQNDKLVEKYSQLDGCSTVELSKAMIKSMGAAEGIDTLTAISVEDVSLIDALYTDAMKYVNGMNRLMSVSYSGMRMTIYASMDEISGKVEHMVIYTDDGSSAVMAILTGSNIDISSAQSMMNINL